MPSTIPSSTISLTFLYGGHDPGVCCRDFGALTLWLLGYPDQALKRSQEALTLVQELSHSSTQATTLGFAAILYQYRREEQAAQERAEATITLSTDQGSSFGLAFGTIVRGWALAEQGREEGIVQMRQGLAAYRTTGAKEIQSYFLALLAEACERAGQREEGLRVLAEALAHVDKTGERFWEAELYRLHGELSLRMGERETGRTGDAEEETENRRAGETEREQESASFPDSPILRFPFLLQRSVSRRPSTLRVSNKPNLSNSAPR